MPNTPTTAGELWRAENRLFATWLKREGTLLRDGALGGPSSTYLAQPVRVLFVLKEPNDTANRWSNAGADLRRQTPAFADLRSTFPVLLLIAFRAQQTSVLPFTTAQEQLRNRDRRVALLESIALVNLKKTPGGPVCNDRSLVTAVDQHGDLLLRQLALYRPHLTIAGGSTVHTLLAQLTQQTVEPAPTPHTRPFFNDKLLGVCLSFFHPQATKGHAYLYNLLHECLIANPRKPRLLLH